MDHLAPVVNAYEPVEVPYHGYCYEGHGFTDFPTPDGVSLTALRDPGSSVDDLKHAAPYLQARFLFGLISEVLDVSVDQSDFVTTENGRQLITTAKLTSYLRYWRFAKAAATSDAAQAVVQARNARAVACLESSYRTWQAIPLFEEIVQAEVQLCVHLVACALEHALGCVSGVKGEHLPWRRERSEFVFGRMLRQGWCPSLIWQIGSSKLSWQYYMSLLGPPQIRKDHSQCLREGSCLVDQQRTTDEDNASQHVCSDQKLCTEIKPDTKAIAEIVEKGSIPLLEYVDGALKVIEHTKTIQYTAISHVWTDGLGNPKASEMPKCQLDRLVASMAILPWTNKCRAKSLEDDKVWQSDDEIVELTPDPVKAKAERALLFWVDTLCVPRDADLKKKAISKMRAIYNRANRVLVFDGGLVNIKGRLSSEEIFSRISVSNWIRRFWTLQEGVLAKVLWFRFGDDCYRQMSELSELRDFPASAWLNEILYYCENFMLDWRTLAVGGKRRHGGFGKAAKVTRVWTELKRRESSFMEDQPVCIATLLDMDIDSIQHPEGYEARFAKLWMEYPALPKRLLFLPGPKLTQAPLRWAPISFKGLDMMPEPPALDDEVQPSHEGLHVRHHGMISDASLATSAYGLIPMRIGDDVYLVRENVKMGNPPWEGLDFTAYDSLAVLLQQYEMKEEAERKPFDWAIGALVGIRRSASAERKEPAVLECEYLRTVSVLKRGTAFETMYRGRSPLMVEPDQEEKLIVAASWTPVDQRWLIT